MQELQSAFHDLSTAHVADACMRLSVPVRCSPAGLRPVLPGVHVVGRALPAQHVGSVDVFLEALEASEPGDVLVVDDGGRTDRACVGDLVALEAARAGITGIVIWGLHRDTRELREIGLPLLSLGASPSGPASVEPQAADALVTARLGEHAVTRDDLVLADDDGAIVVPLARARDAAVAAASIRDTERRQAAAMRGGSSLREQVRFRDYLDARSARGIGFREHLRDVGGAIEE
ncbi:RraA family protein [Agrococcus sp. TF02-05]|uniref:RraA family protein n=1 Tax=Agrococcus sp. TF02-05 TaxID=2815211 RepID=UPI001AA1BB5E|nr:RraA family protein [Agrococcus sp. TF02-05]MBO1770576.1 RraA family protein [Agrococcus sp. TF02-05]